MVQTPDGMDLKKLPYSLVVFTSTCMYMITSGKGQMYFYQSELRMVWTWMLLKCIYIIFFGCLYMMTSEIGQLDFIGPDSRWYGFKATWVFVNDYLWSRSAGLYWSWFLGWGCGPHTGTFLYPSPLCCGSSGSRPSAWPLGCLVGPPLYWNTNHLSVQYQISEMWLK